MGGHLDVQRRGDPNAGAKVVRSRSPEKGRGRGGPPPMVAHLGAARESGRRVRAGGMKEFFPKRRRVLRSRSLDRRPFDVRSDEGRIRRLPLPQTRRQSLLLSPKR
mmetsp:Transcript_11615/g.25442  ORF Transcript_11615/g.25442 Transcript_11615/m.25442 type:complete len:106 (-) Transcript_11615:304-621(-)